MLLQTCLFLFLNSNINFNSMLIVFGVSVQYLLTAFTVSVVVPDRGTPFQRTLCGASIYKKCSKIYCPINLIYVKNKVSRQMLHSTGRNGNFGRTRARCSFDIRDLSLYSVCALDCTKQATFMIKLIYLNSTNVSKNVCPSTVRSQLRFLKFPRPSS